MNNQTKTQQQNTKWIDNVNKQSQIKWKNNKHWLFFLRSTETEDKKQIDSKERE